MNFRELPSYHLSSLNTKDVEFSHILTVSRTDDEADYLVKKVMSLNGDCASENSAIHDVLDLRGEVSLPDAAHEILQNKFGFEQKLNAPDSPNCLVNLAWYIGRRQSLHRHHRLTVVLEITEEVATDDLFWIVLAQARSAGISLVLDMNPKCFKLGDNMLYKVAIHCPVHVYAPGLDVWGYINLFQSGPNEYTFKSVPKEIARQKTLWNRLKAKLTGKKPVFA